MKEFRKQVAILRDENGKPLFVLDIKDILNEEDYLTLKRSAENNLINYKQSEQDKNTQYKQNIESKIKVLAKAIETFTGK